MKKILLAVIVSLFLAGSTNAAEFNTNLKFGSKGADVVKLQEFLAEQNLYSGPITGNFFSLTLKAVKALQTREAISPVSGFFGNLTRAKVNDILDSQLAESVSESVNEPVVSEPAPVSAEVLRLNEILGAVQAQNKLLQDSLALQQAEAQRLRAIADAADAKAQAELQVKQAQDAANAAAMARSEQQAAIEASKPLYSADQLTSKVNTILLLEINPLKLVTPSEPNILPYHTRIPSVIFSKRGTPSDWGDVRVVYNGQTILNKLGSIYAGNNSNGEPIPCQLNETLIANRSCSNSIQFDNLSTGQHTYQVIFPTPGHTDSIYEGSFTSI